MTHRILLLIIILCTGCVRTTTRLPDGTSITTTQQDPKTIKAIATVAGQAESAVASAAVEQAMRNQDGR